MLVFQEPALVQGDILKADRPNLQCTTSDQLDVVLWRGVLPFSTFRLRCLRYCEDGKELLDMMLPRLLQRLQQDQAGGEGCELNRTSIYNQEYSPLFDAQQSCWTLNGPLLCTSPCYRYESPPRLIERESFFVPLLGIVGGRKSHAEEIARHISPDSLGWYRGPVAGHSALRGRDKGPHCLLPRAQDVCIRRIGMRDQTRKQDRTCIFHLHDHRTSYLVRISCLLCE